MSLRQLNLSKRSFRQRAAARRHALETTMNTPASHPGVQHIQDLFREKSQRMYRWTLDPRIPAENNRAERELRPLVIARKVSFGSQSDAGAATREVLMSVLVTCKKEPLIRSPPSPLRWMPWPPTPRRMSIDSSSALTPPEPTPGFLTRLRSCLAMPPLHH